MKLKTYISLLFLLSFQFLTAQVGIGTTSPNSQLDVRSSNQTTPANNDGILIPKIDTFPASNPTASQQGMLVYLTTTTTFAAVSKSPGFYYWDNATTNWIGIQTSSSSEWNLLGNTGTATATHFIGTTDDKDIIFKRFNVRSGFIGNPNTTTGNMNTSFGANSMLSPSGTRNVAIGTNVMPSLSTGARNVSVGDQSMFSTTTGDNNSAFGTGALYSNTIGFGNVAIGRQSLTSSNSNYNTGVGFASLRNLLTGNNNIGIGYNSGYNSNGDNNVFIGNNAGYNETGSNKLFIEYAALTTDSSQNNALVYGEFNTKIFRVNGGLQIGNQSTTGYSFPTARGTSGQVLQTDGTGATSWANSLSNLSLMRSNLSVDQTINSTGWQKINFDIAAFDTNSEFNSGSNSFVATKAGYYEINAGFHTYNKSDAEYYGIAIFKDNAEYQETSSHHYGDKLISRTINCTLYLNVGQTINIYIHNGNAPTTIDKYSGKTYFEVKQLK